MDDPRWAAGLTCVVPYLAGLKDLATLLLTCRQGPISLARSVVNRACWSIACTTAWCTCPQQCCVQEQARSLWGLAYEFPFWGYFTKHVILGIYVGLRTWHPLKVGQGSSRDS